MFRIHTTPLFNILVLSNGSVILLVASLHRVTDQTFLSLVRAAVKLLRDIGGVTGLDHTDANTTGSTGYVFTVDNFLKMLSVTQRLQVRVFLPLYTPTRRGSFITLDAANVSSGPVLEMPYRYTFRYRRGGGYLVLPLLYLVLSQ